jgi:hypothetical protein
MADTARMTQAPVELQIGDDTWKLSPLSIADIGEFEQWMRQYLIRTAMQAANGATASERRDLINRAISAAARLSFTSDEAEGMMESIEGAAMLFYLSLRHNHEAITHRWATNLIDSWDTFEQVVNTIMRLSFPADTTVEPDAGGQAEPGGGKAGAGAEPTST